MRLLLSIALLSFSMLSQVQAGIMDVILPADDLRVVTYTETTPEGAQLRPVTPGDPVYYVVIDAGYHDFGVVIAGEKAPPDKEALKIIGSVLKKQGYLPCNAEHPPALLLVIGWGTLNSNQAPFDPSTGSIPSSVEDRLRFLGADKLNPNLVSNNPHQDELLRAQPGFAPTDEDSETFRTIASGDLFVAALSAYDFQAAQRNERKKLWMTRIACPAKGHWMKDAFTTMIATAGPNIGRATPKPVCINATEKFKSEVRMGDTKVINYVESDSGMPPDEKKKPAADAKPEPLKKAESPNVSK